VLKTLPPDPTALAESAVLQLGEIVGTGPTPPQAVSRDRPAEGSADSLFEHFAWLYIFCREKLFRDDTRRMIQALWPDGTPRAGEELIELGCGPGFYSCRLAERFHEMRVLGVDRSPSQLKWAREKAARLGLDNCRFLGDNVLDLPHANASFDALIASRIFTVLPNRDRAVAEMYRVLRPGGRCFIAEPRYAFRASVPLYTMWLLASITRVKNGYREPSKAKVLSARELDCLFASQPWRAMKTWQDGRYQYALCEKG
jgi:ubiquinone/menaquinone biosynthesis C-methylase UbiE